MRILPKADFESDDDAFIPKPKLRSRRYPCKVMFMGLVCPPIKKAETGEVLADGKILLKRVSEQVQQKRSSYHQHFIASYETNHMLKNHKWRELYLKDGPKLTVAEFLAMIAKHYNLDEDIASDLVFVYHTCSQARSTGKVTKKLVKLCLEETKPVLENRRIRYEISDNEVGERRLKLSDLTLKVNPQKGRIVEKDITCDSDFMMAYIREVGKAIRNTYSFVPPAHPINLFMDNAGGHGKTEIKREYERILSEEFGVLIEWQVPNSPETNMLDLGVWMALQSKVEFIHKGKVIQSNELSNSVHQAFSEIPVVFF